MVKKKTTRAKKGFFTVHKNLKWLLTLLVIICVVAYITLSHSFSANNLVSATPSPTVVPPQKTIPEWGIAYNGTYSIQYPPSFTLCKTGGPLSMCLVNKDLYKNNKDFYDTNWSSPNNTQIYITTSQVSKTTLAIGPNKYAKNVTEADFYDASSNFWRNLPRFSENGGRRDFSYEIVSLGSTKAIKQTTVSTNGVESEDDIKYTYYIFIPNSESTVVIAEYSVAPNSPVFQAFIPTLDKIISTLHPANE
ncbi:MAG TPA: hypothetical protein VG935_02700 [Patescibacteria group bacterium]|nr:hypothetical protein [Patescibacteria group bacterium]